MDKKILREMEKIVDTINKDQPQIRRLGKEIGDEIYEDIRRLGKQISDEIDEDIKLLKKQIKDEIYEKVGKTHQVTTFDYRKYNQKKPKGGK